MRYIILKDNISVEEIKARQKYLNDIFKIYTIPYKYKSHVELKSLPESYGNIVFINGHNNQVFHFLLTESFKEYNIVLITCYFGLIRKIKLKNKAMYYTNVITDKLNGKEYGFNFEITNSEIDLYNCPYNLIEDKIKYSFERIG